MGYVLPAIFLTFISIACGTNFGAFQNMTLFSIFASFACIGIGAVALACWLKVLRIDSKIFRSR